MSVYTAKEKEKLEPSVTIAVLTTDKRLVNASIATTTEGLVKVASVTLETQFLRRYWMWGSALNVVRKA